MSVNSFPLSSRRRWLQAWPLFLLLLIFGAAGVAVWLYWPQILLQSVVWQRNLHVEMTSLLQQVDSQPRRVGLALTGFSLVYGILHALGPGHGKVVIATFLATHPTKMKTSIQLTVAAAVLQGVVAVALVTIMLMVLQLSSRQLHLSSFWLEKGSYLLVIGLGLWLCWRALDRIARLLRKPRLPFRRLVPTSKAPGHQHSEHCGCGHQHVPDGAMLAKAVSGKTKTLVALSMGLRPCSGAIMMLLFSKVIGVYWWGVLSAMAMAAGTAITVTGMAMLVQMSRALALRLSKNGQGGQALVRAALSLAGGLLMVLTGVILWLSAQPVMTGGIRPVF